ncbi:Calcium-binding EF-hand [Artemisia annua]|uniref:Calcium-binding EF-hand n=2 Tax=Artemisia annua TaxID=35608 RepID=A0A2U1PNA6_ARTAN|nr:Calcium-binding EF-hand [Artemisia annua]
MGLKNLFNRKTKNTTKENINTTMVEETISTNTTLPVVPRQQTKEQQLEQVFKKLDVNNDGKISFSELGSVMGSLAGNQPTDDELKKMIMEVDKDGDGFIDLEEFIELNTKVDSSELLELIEKAFSMFDVDKNGLITAEELLRVMRSLHEDYSIEECKKMIAGVDQDGDGMINLDEFKVMMMSGVRTSDVTKS